MAARYVRIPYGDRVKYPAVCPFTGRASPRGLVTVTRGETQMILPIPFIGLFRLGRKGRMRFPASKTFAAIAKVLALLPVPLVAAGFILFVARKDDPHAWYYLVAGIGGAVAARILLLLWLRKVRVVRIGMGGLEVRFSSESYAREFSRLNEFGCRDQPSEKRARPVTVNNLGS